VLDRVARGERLIVLCHKKPVATLQPLDGTVVQPFGGEARDVYGRALGSPDIELSKLEDSHHQLLLSTVRRGVIKVTNLSGSFDWEKGIEELSLRGLASRTTRGWELTGRGILLREALQQALQQRSEKA
jgi:antitoxin (DNA-binding transcriptional repressor) of toxin-antitoxin stability system